MIDHKSADTKKEFLKKALFSQDVNLLTMFNEVLTSEYIKGLSEGLSKGRDIEKLTPKTRITDNR